MAFDALGHRSLTEHISAERDDDALWLFQHIPKTAGSSFGTELARHRPPYRNIHVDYDDRSAPFDVQMERAVDRFIAESRDQRFASASGHLSADLVDRIVGSIDNVKVVTFLRHPVARVISDYRYQRTPLHPPHREFIETYPTLESYVSAPASQNKMTHFVTGSSEPDEPHRAFDIAAGRYVMIGLLEMYPMSFNCIFEMLGRPDRMPSLHKRRTPETEDNEVVVTEDLEASIRDVNQHDMALFTATKEVLVRHRDEWRQRRSRPER